MSNAPNYFHEKLLISPYAILSKRHRPSGPKNRTACLESAALRDGSCREWKACSNRPQSSLGCWPREVTIRFEKRSMNSIFDQQWLARPASRSTGQSWRALGRSAASLPRWSIRHTRSRAARTCTCPRARVAADPHCASGRAARSPSCRGNFTSHDTRYAAGCIAYRMPLDRARLRSCGSEDVAAPVA